MLPEQHALKNTQFIFPGQTGFYQGKVRDVYTVGDKLVMIATDRISAFDHILPRPIPFKGQVLNQTALHFLEATRDIVRNWVIHSPDPNVAVGFVCAPVRVEMVIRGYLAGHAWRTYAAGARTLCGVPLPEGLRESDPLPEPVITPTTKAAAGHDEDISRDAVLSAGLVTEAHYLRMEQATRDLFRRGSEMAATRGLILVDTKYEFGILGDEVVLIDEIHTPDSSRYFIAEGYALRQRKGERQTQLSKEFVREWLMDRGFQGREGEQMPEMPDAFVWDVSMRYIQLYESITGRQLQKRDTRFMQEQIFSNVLQFLEGSAP
jgi:phosphoribosylaminoimidazole-succinocarboxamide synthase